MAFKTNQEGVNSIDIEVLPHGGRVEHFVDYLLYGQGVKPFFVFAKSIEAIQRRLRQRYELRVITGGPKYIVYGK